MTFLIAIATRAPIREQMEDGGFTAEDHAEGWALLNALGRYPEVRRQKSARDRAKTAMNELTAWAHANFGRFQAAVRRLNPAYVGQFPAIGARSTSEALLAVAQLLEALRQERANEHNTDHATRDPSINGNGGAKLGAILARRGLDEPTVARLTELLAAAQQLRQISDEDPEHDPRLETLLRLHDWYRDWAATARRFVVRRDHQISLGIAGRRRQTPNLDDSESQPVA